MRSASDGVDQCAAVVAEDLETITVIGGSHVDHRLPVDRLPERRLAVPGHFDQEPRGTFREQHNSALESPGDTAASSARSIERSADPAGEGHLGGRYRQASLAEIVATADGAREPMAAWSRTKPFGGGVEVDSWDRSRR